jgi:hypothetical protein
VEFGWQITASDGPLDRTAGFVSRDIAPEVSASHPELIEARNALRLRLRLRLDSDAIVHSSPQTLFAAEVALSGLHTDMP